MAMVDNEVILYTKHASMTSFDHAMTTLHITSTSTKDNPGGYAYSLYIYEKTN